MKAKTLVKYLVRGASERRSRAAAKSGVDYALAASRLLLGRDPTAGELAQLGSDADPMRAFRFFLAQPDHQIAFNQIVATRELPRGRYLVEPDETVAALMAACGIPDNQPGAGRPSGMTWRALIARVAGHVASVLTPEFRSAKKRSRLAAWALSGEEGTPAKRREVYSYLLDYYLNLYQYLDAPWYRQSGAMSDDGPADPLEHYVQVGAAKGRSPNAYFDPQYYRASVGRPIPDYRPEIVDYCTIGWIEGAKPGPVFDPADYMRANPDVAAALFEPLSHYLRFGKAEGRPGGIRASRREGLPAPVTSGIPYLGRTLEKLIGRDERFERPSEPASPERLRIDCIIPDFLPGQGGHMAIFKLLYWLEVKGHEVHIWIDYPSERQDVQAIYSDILTYFRPLKCQVHMLSERDRVETDVLLLTDRWTLWAGLRSFKAHAPFYFVQDLETTFHKAGAETLLTEHGYRLGLPAICSSPWLADKMREYGSEVAAQFIYPADSEIYYPSETPSDVARPPVIAFYSRASTERRAVQLAILGLVELHNRGVDFTVATFGQHFDDTIVWPFPVEHHHVLSERGLADLYRDSDIGLVLSATNYSITAVEMMACGLPVVDIDTESTRATYPADTAILAKPTPAGIADALQAVIADRGAIAPKIDKAKAWVAASRWRDIADDVEAAFVKSLDGAGALADAGARAAPPTVGRALKASVVIPTFNGAETLGKVLDATLSQAGPIEFDVLCIDSGSTDGSLDLIADRPSVRLHTIAKTAFNHGDTRNLGVELSDAEYVAFLTQDALPCSDTWLFDLAGVLNAVPAAAGAFGRHIAYPDASPFTKRDMDAHFDRCKTGLPVISRYPDLGQTDESDDSRVGLLRFFSNNNSCISRKAWRRIPFPRINFGEDQAWAWRMLKAGYAKVYVDSAAVYHSHEHTVDQERSRARTEAAFYRLAFGVQFGVDDAQAVQARTDQLNGADIGYAMEKRIAWGELDRRMRLNRSRMEGYLLGASDQEIVY